MKAMYTDIKRHFWHLPALVTLKVALVLMLSASAPASAQQRIIAGSSVSDGTYPWVVALVGSRFNSLFNGQFCGGSLIAPRWVMTAAHCVTSQSNPNAPDDPQTIDLVINQTDLGTGLTGERIGAQKVFIHPDYYGAGTTDIALIYMESASSVQPVDLVYPDSTLEAPGVLATVVGWGVTSWSFLQSGFPSPKLREVDLPVVTPRNCDAAYAGSINENILICAGYANGGRDACQGDSGGPLFIFDQSLNGYSQAGIVSFGRGCALADTPGVYTRVSSQVGWIQSTIHTVEPNTVPGSGSSKLLARFKMSCAELTCTFDAITSKVGPSPIVSYLWQLGDGRVLTDPRVVVSYSTVGYKQMRLTVSDAYGNQSAKIRWAKPYRELTSRNRVNYQVTALAKQKSYFPSQNGQWVNKGALAGRLRTTEGTKLNFKLQYWAPSKNAWTVVENASGTAASRKIKRVDKPGLYRWKIKAGPDGGEYNLSTNTP